MAQQTVKPPLTAEAIKEFFKKPAENIPDNDIWYGYFYVQQKLCELLYGRTPHVTEQEAEFIRGLHEAEFNFRQIATITSRSLETLHRIIKEGGSK
jgi:hypothetical protein